MAPRIALAFAALLALGIAGRGAPPAPPAAPPAAAKSAAAARSITAARLLSHVEVLASEDFAGRAAGTDGGLLAATWLARRLASYGLQPPGEGGMLHRFTALGRDMTNVVAKLEGSDPRLRDEHVLVTAHFDHLGVVAGRMHPGADDNASGCAVLLEVARAFTLGDRPRRSLWFVAFDGEELGLRGSRHFVAHPPIPLASIVAVLNLDMVGRGDGDAIHLSGPRDSADLHHLLNEAASGGPLALRLDFDRAWRRASDHAPFADARVPYLYFGVPEHPDYHRPTDTPDKLNPALMQRVALLLHAVAARLADQDGRPAFDG